MRFVHRPLMKRAVTVGVSARASATNCRRYFRHPRALFKSGPQWVGGPICGSHGKLYFDKTASPILPGYCPCLSASTKAVKKNFISVFSFAKLKAVSPLLSGALG